MSSPHINFNITGTLIAVVYFNTNFYLLSDGRLVDSRNMSVISNSHSKLHKLTNYSAMLTAGRYLNNLAPEIARLCSNGPHIYVDDVINLAKTEIKRQWEELIKRINVQYKQEKFFCFIVGFDKKHNPRIFYIDNQTTPPFDIQERQLTFEIEIAAISHGSGNSIENPSSEIASYLNQNIQSNYFIKNPQKVILEAFNQTLRKLSTINLFCGGKTFLSIIDLTHGYQIII